MYFRLIRDFCSEDCRSIFSEIDHSVDNRTREVAQRGAWDFTIQYLQECFAYQLSNPAINDGYILFEYYIPRLSKRPDVILLIRGIVFVLEFKVGEESGNKTVQKKQTVAYAEALKYFHNRSWGCPIVPILVATQSTSRDLHLSKNRENKVYKCLVCNQSNLVDTILSVLANDKEQCTGSCSSWANEWVNGQYDPNPSIIEATLRHYNSHGVEEIRNAEADTTTLTETSAYIIREIAQAKKNHERAIFFVTGVPGAGKTQIGLEVVSKTHKEYKSVYLSGNNPLVNVLSAALTKDTEQQEKYAKKIDPDSFSGELYKPTSMVQIIHGYRRAVVEKIERITEEGQIILKPNSQPEVEHVVVFDEAQRAWTRDKLQSPGRSGKVSCLQNTHFPYSEPGFLLWSMDQQKEWAAIVCLVGGGQEINEGEAGITEWFRSLHRFPNWKIYMPKELKDKEYGGDELDALRASLPNDIKTEQKLHLAVSRRSIRSENVSSFVKQLLDGEEENAQNTLNSFCSSFPIVITRDLQKAKQWISRKKAEKGEYESPQRAGILMSSKAFRLRPYGFEPKIVGQYNNVAKWFLGPPNNAESSDFLEVALSEFFVQGLELDWTIVMWDADFRVILDNDGHFKSWDYYGGFNGEKWTKNNAQQEYQLNAYRVLLTRARRGMVIFVPKGDNLDPSRNPEWYDNIFKYLHSLGIEEI